MRHRHRRQAVRLGDPRRAAATSRRASSVAAEARHEPRLPPRRRRDLPALLRHHPRRNRPRALLRRRSRRRRPHDPCLRQPGGRRAYRIRRTALSPRPARRSPPARRSSAIPRWWRTASPAPACRHNNDVLCTLRDPRVPALAQKLGTTRSAAALELWRERLAGSVVAIGNAPTALFHLLDMLAQGAPKPAAILGIPVGFVGAAESKDALAADSSRRALSDRARPHRRQRHDGRGRQRAGEGRPMSARLIGVGVGPGDPELLTLKAARSLAEADVVAHFAKAGNASNARAHRRAASASRHRGVAAALSGDHRNADQRGRVPRGHPRFLRQLRRCGGEPSRSRPHRRGAERGRSAVLWLLHASACAACAALPGRGRARRHRDVRLLVARRRADRPGRRCVCRAARHACRKPSSNGACWTRTPPW